MSEDVLERAKIIAEKMGDRRIYYAGCWTLAEDLGYSKTGENTEFKEVAHPEDFIWCEVLPGINLLPELIAEVERLQDKHARVIKKFRAYIIKDAIAVCDAFDWRDEEISRQREENDAKDARIKELEAAVVDGRAQYLLLLDCNQDCTAWNFDELFEEDQNTLRRQARIILEMEEPWAYVQLREAREQVKLLEAAFLRSNAAMRYYQEGNRGPWPQLGEKFKEPYQEKAREALKRIKEGGKDESQS